MAPDLPVLFPMEKPTRVNKWRFEHNAFLDLNLGGGYPQILNKTCSLVRIQSLLVFAQWQVGYPDNNRENVGNLGLVWNFCYVTRKQKFVVAMIFLLHTSYSNNNIRGSLAPDGPIAAH